MKWDRGACPIPKAVSTKRAETGTNVRARWWESSRPQALLRRHLYLYFLHISTARQQSRSSVTFLFNILAYFVRCEAHSLQPQSPLSPSLSLECHLSTRKECKLPNDVEPDPLLAPYGEQTLDLEEGQATSVALSSLHLSAYAVQRDHLEEEFKNKPFAPETPRVPFLKIQEMGN